MYFCSIAYICAACVLARKPMSRKGNKNRKPTTDSQLTKFSTWPDSSQKKIKLKWFQDLNDDLKLIEKINDLNAFDVRMEDFLSLNGDVSVYGWQHVMNFALYEKYNFIVPLLKNNLSEKHYEELFEPNYKTRNTHGLRDFIYVYCTMLTLILRKKNETRLFPSIYDALEEFFKSLEDEDALGNDLLDDLIAEIDSAL